MRKSVLPLAVGAAMLAGAPAHAQHFVYEVDWGPVEQIGGLDGPDGRQYGGGSVNGTYTARYPDGTTRSGSMRCVGMDQPDGGIFAIHMTCNGQSGDVRSTLVFGCNFIGERGPETPLGCVGGIQGHGGEIAGRRGAVTMEWYSQTKSRGTGQWYGGDD